MSGKRSAWQLLRPLIPPLKDHWKLAIITILCGIGKFLIPLVIAFGLKVIIDSLQNESLTFEQQSEQWILWIGISIAAIIATGIATYYRSALGQKLTARIQHRLRTELFHHLQHLGLAFFGRHHAGALGSRVSSDINHVSVVIDRGLIIMVMDLTTIAVIGTVLVWTNLELTLLIMIPIALSATTLKYFSPRLRRVRKALQESTSRLTGHAAETFAGITLVKASGGEESTDRAFDESSQRVTNLHVDTSKLSGKFQSYSLSILMLGQLIILMYGGWMIINGHPGLTVGGILLFLYYYKWIDGSVNRVVDGMLQLQDGMAALERIDDIMRQQADPLPPAHGTTPALSGEITFDQVAFHYQPEQPILHDMNFTLERGKTYALVGPSGGGKSSLFKLLLRFHDPQTGTVRIDGHNLRDIDLTHYRQQTAVVLQDPIMFSTTIAENIAFPEPEVDMNAVRHAARLAQADTFIESLPDGYETKLGERGVNLSGGQRQRIALARALMRNPCLLLLDEATSALDAVTEQAIKEVVDDLRGSRTIMIIAHRLSTVRDVDEILVIEHGRVTERGSYQQLIRGNGMFADMVSEQQLAMAG